jgi:hypothetical protein
VIRQAHSQRARTQLTGLIIPQGSSQSTSGGPNASTDMADVPKSSIEGSAMKVAAEGPRASGSLALEAPSKKRQCLEGRRSPPRLPRRLPSLHVRRFQPDHRPLRAGQLSESRHLCQCRLPNLRPKLQPLERTSQLRPLMRPSSLNHSIRERRSRMLWSRM